MSYGYLNICVLLIISVVRVTTSGRVKGFSETVPEEQGCIVHGEFSSDASRILAVSSGSKVTVCNNGHDLRAHTFKHEYEGSSARFSRDGRELLTKTRNKVWLWRIDDDTLVWCIPDVRGSDACFTPDGKGLVLRGDDWVEEWCTASRERCWKVRGKDISGIALSSPYESRRQLC